MEISIIIPVYNAAAFLHKTVASVLTQPEAKEIILVEDGSTDGSFDICRELDRAHPRIKLLSHPDRENRGAGASRNLGARHAACEYIAFLDADDFYLPGRFSSEQVKFDNPDTDGVYGATGFHIYNELADKLYRDKGYLTGTNTTVNAVIPPEELPYLLLGCPKRHSQNGYFMLDALTVKKSVFHKAGYFDPKLKVHQDTEWMIRLSLTCRIETGEYAKPVAMRGVHEHNRIVKVKNEYNTRYMMYQALAAWALTQSLRPELSRLIEQNKAVYRLLAEKAPVSAGQRLRCFRRHPGLLFNPNTFRLLMQGGISDTAKPTMSFPLRSLLLAQRGIVYLRRRLYLLFH